MPKIVCVVGPTASGKTKFGVAIAKRFHGEVVSVDSMQIYRGMTVGTAAPTEEEMEGVPHHMIGVADPWESWSVARFTEMADGCIRDILARGKLPVLVGGTGLYLDALVRGTDFAAGNARGETRVMLQSRVEQEGIAPLFDSVIGAQPADVCHEVKADHANVERIHDRKHYSVPELIISTMFFIDCDQACFHEHFVRIPFRLQILIQIIAIFIRITQTKSSNRFIGKLSVLQICICRLTLR